MTRSGPVALALPLLLQAGGGDAEEASDLALPFQFSTRGSR